MDVASWLRSLGLEQYVEAFRDNDIDAETLPQLSAEDLKDLGVASVGHRKKILQALAALATSPAAGTEPAKTKKVGEAERRQLTVMFVDLVGSTALSQRLDPEDMREVIRVFQNAVAGEIGRFEGHVAEFMGDGVLAYFGWPRSHEDEPERAVRAALATIGEVSKINSAGQTLACRVGIATGLVVVGTGAAQQAAAVGETPNLAARLQAIAEPGTAVISESTRRLLGDLYVLQDLGPQTLKGIDGTACAYAVVAERTLESRFAAKQTGGMAPIVGRDQELALLVERWRQAKAGEGQVILLTGEAGIGKSRIAEALVAAVSGEGHVLLRYQCSPYHGDSALYPVIQQIAHAAGFVQGESNDARLDKLETVLAMGTDRLGEAVPLVAALMGLDGEARYGRLPFTPQQRRNRTLAVLVDQLRGLAKRRPVLWIVEDAHWIDPTTLELIELTLDDIQNARVHLLITARPTFSASFASHPVVTRLALNRLARAATQAIVMRITRGKRLPDILVDEIAAKTDGVPLFVEEMTKAVVESGALRETDDAYHLDQPLSTLAVPVTLHDSLMARLDRLHGVKEVAQTAAVIGRNFDHQTVTSVAGLPEQEITDSLGRLVEAELIFRRGIPPNATYLFKHALVRDAAYESLLKTRRVAIHERLLELLESRDDAAPEVKAQHAEAAGLLGRALDLWEEAGTKALGRPAYKEAIASFQNGIRLCRALGKELQWRRREQRLYLAMGQALLANQGYSAPATLEAFDQALALAEQIGDVSVQLPAIFGQWAGYHIAGTGSGAYAQRFAELVNEQADVGPRLVGLRMLGLERFFEGRFKESLELVDRAIETYDPRQHRDLGYRFGHDPKAAAMNYRAWNLWYLGFPDQAAQTIEENLYWLRELNHPNTTGIGLCYGATITNILLRRPRQVEEAAREAIELAEEMSLALWHAWGLIHLGWSLFQQGTGTGIDEIEAGLREARQMRAGRLEPFHLAIAAEAYAKEGQADKAQKSLSAAFAALRLGHHQNFASELHRLRGLISLQFKGGDHATAEADLRRALDIAREQEALALQLRAARDLTAFLAQRGEKQQGVDLLAPIHHSFTEGLDTADLVEAKALIAAL
jgi:class 3 adenylate cyclase/tetratricopeptide (TPR) repeat protein